LDEVEVEDGLLVEVDVENVGMAAIVGKGKSVDVERMGEGGEDASDISSGDNVVINKNCVDIVI